MTTITVLHSQSLMDIAIQTTGSVLNAIEIAKANNISITKKLIAGDILIIPDSITIDVSVLSYYKSKYKKPIQPATDITETEEPGEMPEGISYWIVNQNFIVQ